MSYKLKQVITLSLFLGAIVLTQHIDLKLSTHLNEVKSGAKFEDGQNRTKKFKCHGYHIETNVGSMEQKINFVQIS